MTEKDLELVSVFNVTECKVTEHLTQNPGGRLSCDVPSSERGFFSV